MEKLDVRYHPGAEYRELFNVTVDSLHCTDTGIGLANDGRLLFIDSKLANNSSAYWVDSEFYTIDNEEFQHYLALARANGYVEKAIQSGQTTEEELESLSG